MSKNILVVEPNDYHRRIYARFIKTLGYEVGTANNARSAIEIIDALKEKGISVDAIITGMQMPGGSGLTFLQAQNERKDSTPCLVHSSETTFQEENVQLDNLTKISGIFPFAQFHKKESNYGYIKNFLDLSCE
ncbi:MAG: Response regulator receiver domain [Candidatus Parcubacteria bacterium]|jgi:DNA-binding NtrC family response regulator